MVERMFPVLWQSLSWRETAELEALGCPRAVPWRLLEPHARQAMLNHDQTLERLAQRGGLSPEEMICVLRDEPCSNLEERGWPSHSDAAHELMSMLAEESSTPQDKPKE